MRLRGKWGAGRVNIHLDSISAEEGRIAAECNRFEGSGQDRSG